MEITTTVLNATQDIFTVAMTHNAGKAVSETVPSPIRIKLTTVALTGALKPHLSTIINA